VLLSDGQANVGEFRPEALFARSDALRAEGIGLSTIGVGVDFNAPLMQGMAEHGGGRFRFMENPAEIARGFAKELELSAKLVAADVKVILHPRDGVRVEEVYGSLFERVGSDVVVRLPDLASTTQFFVRARLSVDADGDSLVPVVDTSATFAEVATDRTRVATRGNTLQASVTRVAQEVDTMANKEVLAEGINARGIEDAKRAMELMRAGNKEEALRRLDLAMGNVQVANRELHHAKLTDSWATFGNLRALFAASSNALGGEETYEGRLAQRKAIRNFGSNNTGKE